MRVNIAGAVAELAIIAATFESEKLRLLEELGKRGEEKAKEIIGQEDVQGQGGFADHAPLADSTVDYKLSHGYGGQVSATDPLLRDGDLHDSITHIVQPEHDSVVIGSDSKIAKYQELGTRNMPPRSFLGIAGEQLKEDAVKLGLELALTVFKRR